MGAMGARIIFFLDTQTDKLILAAMIVLIILGIGQFIRVGRTNRQLKYLTDRLADYLKAVLEDTEEELPAQDAEFVSRQEQNMRDALELQKQQRQIRDAQVFDAVLSEMYP